MLPHIKCFNIFFTWLEGQRFHRFISLLMDISTNQHITGKGLSIYSARLFTLQVFISCHLEKGRNFVYFCVIFEWCSNGKTFSKVTLQFLEGKMTSLIWWKGSVKVDLCEFKLLSLIDDRFILEKAKFFRTK